MATIRKMRNKWQAIVRLKGHKPKSKSFTLKSDAASWAKAIEVEIQKGIFVDTYRAEAMTVSIAIHQYLDSLKDKRKKRIESSTAKPILDALGMISLLNLTNNHLATFRDEQLEKVGATTVVHQLSLLNKVLRIAQLEWDIPFPKGIPSVRKPKRLRGWDRRLLDGEYETLINALSETQIVQQIVILAIETGMRRGEIVKICRKDIDPQKRILYIPETKTGEPREIPLTNEALSVLTKQQTLTTDRLFNIQPDSISQAFERACRRADISGLRFHDLRHEATSRFFEMGLNTMEVASITGHKTLEMLNRYTHLRAEKLVKKMGGIYSDLSV